MHELRRREGRPSVKFPKAKLALFMYSFGVATGRPTITAKQRLMTQVSIQAVKKAATIEAGWEQEQDTTK